MDGVDTFTCSCDLGFTGANCQTNINDCLETNCSRHGQCVDGVILSAVSVILATQESSVTRC